MERILALSTRVRNLQICHVHVSNAQHVPSAHLVCYQGRVELVAVVGHVHAATGPCRLPPLPLRHACGVRLLPTEPRVPVRLRVVCSAWISGRDVYACRCARHHVPGRARRWRHGPARVQYEALARIEDVPAHAGRAAMPATRRTAACWLTVITRIRMPLPYIDSKQEPQPSQPAFATPLARHGTGDGSTASAVSVKCHGRG